MRINQQRAILLLVSLAALNLVGYQLYQRGLFRTAPRNEAVAIEQGKNAEPEAFEHVGQTIDRSFTPEEAFRLLAPHFGQGNLPEELGPPTLLMKQFPGSNAGPTLCYYTRAVDLFTPKFELQVIFDNGKLSGWSLPGGQQSAATPEELRNLSPGLARDEVLRIAGYPSAVLDDTWFYYYKPSLPDNGAKIQGLRLKFDGQKHLLDRELLLPQTATPNTR